MSLRTGLGLQRLIPLFVPYEYKKANTNSAKPFHNKAIVLFSSVKLIALKSLISALLIITGLGFMVTKVFWPVVNTYATTENYTPIISPIASDAGAVLSVKPDEEFSFKELGARFRTDENYVEQDGVIFTEENELGDDIIIPDEDRPDHFLLTIPALDIEDALVETDSTNLDPINALGHYKGTCLPNEACNMFIFGHSTYTSTPNRYKQGDYSAVFSRLEELEYGDEIIINYNGEEYRYVIELKKVERPENVDPLAQPLPKSLGRYDSTIELFTCVPPGTTKYRLSVVGKLVR